MSARILVVDDSPTISKGRRLHPGGALVRAAAGGGSGKRRSRCSAARPSIWCCFDYVMPRMNGYQFCRELRADPNLKNLPVVLMSAKGDNTLRRSIRTADRGDRRDHQALRRARPDRGGGRRAQEAHRGSRPSRARSRRRCPRSQTRASKNFRPSRASFSDDPGLRRVQAAHEFARSLSQVAGPELRRSPSFLQELTEASTSPCSARSRPTTWALCRRCSRCSPWVRTRATRCPATSP